MMAELFLLKLSSDECHWTLLMRDQHGSDNGLVPSGNKPLPEPMLTQIYVAIWRHYNDLTSLSMYNVFMNDGVKCW